MVSIWKLHLKVSLVYHVYHHTDIFRWICHTYVQCSVHCKDIDNFLHRTGNILKNIFGNRSLTISCSWKSNLIENHEISRKVYHLLYNYDPSNPPYRNTYHLCADKFCNLVNRPGNSFYRNIPVRTLK